MAVTPRRIALVDDDASVRKALARLLSASAFDIDTYGSALAPYGHTFTAAGAPGTSAAEIGAVEALEFLPGGAILAAAEPTRRGGGAAGTVKQVWP